ncbi:MAG TPA: class I SAM-dependent methyltransferase [Gemmatimonadaceae bacterium]|nr:class I SAM-dependent methyltransferase [Gemmatimonadaceae bacterium]
MTTSRDHFSEIARDYAAYRPRYPEALFDFLAERAPARGVAWDCACGNGQATLDLAERFDRVIATDSSAAQIAQAPAHPRIEWRIAPAERSGIPGGACDLVTVAQALHWLDIDAFFREAARVSRPRGLVAVWSYGGGSLDHPEANGVLRHFARNVIGPYWPPERRLVDEGYRSIRMPFDEIEVPDFEMAEWWTVEQLAGYVSTWSATSGYRKALHEDPMVDFEARLREVWVDPDEVRRVAWRLTVRAGRVS